MAIENFSHYGSHAVIFDFVLNKKSGSITFQPGTRKLFFEEGNLVFASSELNGEHFTDILVTMEVLDAETLEELRAATPQGESMGRKLKELGLATPAQLAQALKQQITSVIDRVFATEEGTLEVNEGPLTARVPKLKIQILALVIRTFANLEDDELLAEVSQGQIAIASANFAEVLAETPLPGQYQSLVDLLERGWQSDAAELAEELQWETRMVESTLYVLHLLGAVLLREPKERQGELFAGPEEVEDTFPGAPDSDEGDDLDATALDQDNPLDLSMQGHDSEMSVIDDELEQDLAMEDEAEDEFAIEDDQVDANLEDDDALSAAPDQDDLDQITDRSPAQDPMQGDDQDELESLEENEFDRPTRSLTEDDFDALEMDDDEDDRDVSGPPTDLLAAALDDTLDEDDAVDEDSNADLWNQLAQPQTTPAEEADDAFDLASDQAENSADEPFQADSFSDEAEDDPFAGAEAEAEADPFADQAGEQDDFAASESQDDPFAEEEPLADPFGAIDDDEPLANPFADDEEEDDAFADADAASYGATKAQLEYDGEDELGLDAMDKAALELEQDGYDFDEPDTAYATSKNDLGKFDMEDDSGPNYSGEFSADDLAAAMPEEDFDLHEEEPAASYAPPVSTSAKQSDPDEATTRPYNIIMPSRDEDDEAPAPPKKKSRSLPALLGVLLLAAAGYAVFTLYGPSAKKAKAPAEPQTSLAETQAPATEAPSESDQTTAETSTPQASNSSEPVGEPVGEPASEPDQQQAAAKPEADKKLADKPVQNLKTAANNPEPLQEPASEPTSFNGDISAYSEASQARFKAQNKPYTIALVLACEQGTVNEFLSKHSSEDVYVLPKTFKGRSCYAICWGTYANSEAAKADLSKVNANLKTEGTWVINARPYL